MYEFIEQWLGWLVAAIAATIAIRGKVSFDVNEYIKEKRKRRKEQLESLCPHVYFAKQNGDLVIKSAVQSIRGFSICQCGMCGRIFSNEDLAIDEAKYWMENPKELQKRNEEMEKLQKKLKL